MYNAASEDFIKTNNSCKLLEIKYGCMLIKTS